MGVAVSGRKVVVAGSRILNVLDLDSYDMSKIGFYCGASFDGGVGVAVVGKGGNKVVIGGPAKVVCVDISDT